MGFIRSQTLAHRAAQVSGEGLHDKRLQLIGNEPMLMPSIKLMCQPPASQHQLLQPAELDHLA